MPRKQIHYIYKTTCKVTNRYYIGMHSTSNINDNYLGSGKRLRYSIKKYGVSNHNKEILEFLADRNSLKNREAEIVNETVLTDPNCMNMKPGGFGGFSSVEHAKKAALSGGNSFTNKLKTDALFLESRKLLASAVWKKLHKEGRMTYDNMKGKHHTDETKNKIKNTRNQLNVGHGEKNSQFGTFWVTNELENKKVKNVEYWISLGWRLGYNRKLFKPDNQ